MNNSTNEQNQIILKNLKSLIRSLTQDDLSEIYQYYKALFQIGEPSIPQIRESILKFDCSKVKYDNEFSIISGLVNLIHDIDEIESRKIVRQLKNQDCNVALARILDSICEYSVNDYAQYNSCNIKIFEHKKINSKQHIRAKIEKWLNNVPINDLQGIERIYILRKKDLEVLGNYKPILYRINLVWINTYSSWNPMSWVDNFIIENTLYHEIGHYVFRHTFGQDDKQEKEAENYADQIMMNSNRLFFRILRLLKN